MKCCICGAVRNSAFFLDDIFKNMEKIGSVFEDYVIILAYDPSSDNSLDKIKQYQSVNPRVILYENQSLISPYRTHRIAFARNKCLDMIRSKYSDYNFFIMMDCDNVCSSNINLNVLRSNIHKQGWDALSFNKEPYYDIWALSIRPFVFSYEHFPSEVGDKMRNYIGRIMRNIPPGKLIKCSSAFNGFAIYRTNKFLNCRYDGRIRLDLIPPGVLKKNIAVARSRIIFRDNVLSGVNGKYEDCEHRAFHLQAIQKNNARIRISPEILFP